MEAIGVFAALSELLAIWLIGSKNRAGFLTGLVGNGLWVLYVGLSKSAWGLLLICPAAAILNARGWLLWKGSSHA